MASINNFRGKAIGDEAGAIHVYSELGTQPVRKQTLGATFGKLTGQSPNLIWIVETVNMITRDDQWLLNKALVEIHKLFGLQGKFETFDEGATSRGVMDDAIVLSVQEARPDSPAERRAVMDLRVIFGSENTPEFN